MGRDALREAIELIFDKNYVETGEGWNKVIDAILDLFEKELDKGV